jgi:hypothetical protein
MLAVHRPILHSLAPRPGSPPDGVLLATFQRRRAWRTAAPRSERLPESAHATIEFAEFEGVSRRGSSWRVPLTLGTSLASEWSVVCDTPRRLGCLVGREIGSTPAPSAVLAGRLQTRPRVRPSTLREASRFTNSILDHLLGVARAPERRSH